MYTVSNEIFSSNLSGSSELAKSECMSFTNKINNTGDKGSPCLTQSDIYTSIYIYLFLKSETLENSLTQFQT